MTSAQQNISIIRTDFLFMHVPLETKMDGLAIARVISGIDYLKLRIIAMQVGLHKLDNRFQYMAHLGQLEVKVLVVRDGSQGFHTPVAEYWLLADPLDLLVDLRCLHRAGRPGCHSQLDATASALLRA